MSSASNDVLPINVAGKAPLSAHPLYGCLLIILSVLCNAARVHVDKWALHEGASPQMLVALAGLFAGLLFVLCGVAWQRLGWRAADLHQATPRGLWLTLRGHAAAILLAAAATALGSFLGAYCIKEYGPELAAFLGNMTFAFLVLGGVIVGRERLTLAESVVIAVIVAGAFLFSYRGGRFEFAAIGIMGASCLFTAAKQLTVKLTAGRSSLPCVMALTLLFMSLWTWTTMLISGRWEWPTMPALGIILLGAVLGSMIGMSLLYAGFLRLGAARGGPIDALRPLIVLLIGLTLGTPLPGWVACLGGLMILLGSAALAYLSRRQPPAIPSNPEFAHD